MDTAMVSTEVHRSPPPALTLSSILTSPEDGVATDVDGHAPPAALSVYSLRTDEPSARYSHPSAPGASFGTFAHLHSLQ
ncbi:uncharacterized protein SCHCODRAFT_02641420 [Schizophyllum commune H4-8]|uniref:uncharacterized protein n=1 Tax=Schizophyllum commune (strain H4-8 / FGSC 9210) TaxID=578458 RepID=UPI002160FF57|nr:uncharacterized protein SCHCODRAFT_02641420 [Schizophyllum commune H4-8]KAI5886314.1 hypothetical protein SCHCODRAFT_02641420 [Schizophyllum commune H4-8]